MRSSALAMFVAAAASLTSMIARADEAPLSLRYDVNSTDVAQGETFQLDVVLTNHSNETVEELALPDFPKGLTVVQERKASSQRVSVGNGKQSTTTELRFMFLLRADEAGTFKIPEANAKLGKNVAHAAPISIKVSANGADSSSGSTSTPVAPDKQPGARFGKSPPSAFLEITLDHDNAWVGQQITATTEVYSEQPLANWPRLGPLKPPGFLCTPLLGDERPNPTQRTIAGKLYYIYLVNKDALFPVNAGDSVIPVQTVDLQPAGSFFSRPREMTVKSSPLKIKVKALPDDKPARFAAGNVGLWNLSSSIRPQSASLDQPFTLSIVATGTGSLEQLQMPTWDSSDPAAVRVFPSTTKIERRDVTNENAELGGRVVEEMLVQPLREGELDIPSFTLAYFDPDAGQFKTTSTQPVVLHVRASKSGAPAGTPGAQSGPRQTIAKGARPLRTHVVAEGKHGESPVVAGAVAFLAGAALFVAGSRRRKLSASAAGKRAHIRRDRQRALDEAKARGDLAGLERVLLDALAERCGADVKARATEDLGALLSERGIEASLAADVVKLIRDVEAARYSPSVGGERARLADQCIALVARVEAA
jgi:hypothetical protein